ncbi:S-adenosyl-L-methionine-dependent methyltransferase [Xylogone sp. PMI_703]|nr:S-adenosyl-L-methionine-dependent methyltransferase [Xylogone sp. PMI_703]
MRILTTTGIFKSVSEDVYSHTKYSLAYIDGTEVDFYTLCVDEINPTALRIPQYLASHPPDSILDPKQSPFSWDNNAEGKVFYQVLLDHPERLKRFNIAMTTQESQLPVLGMFPFSEVAKELEGKLNEVGIQQDNAFIVDVAGGRGQSLLQIRREITESLGEENVKGLGKWILQDRKPVLDAIPKEELPGVEKVVIDFFEGQPIKYAQIYYLRRIMHNWQDAECRTILSHISAAMAPTSRLLIGEMVVPESPENQPDKTVYWMDLCMLVIGGKERSQKEFESLLATVGLRLVKIWRSKAGVQCVIECVKV